MPLALRPLFVIVRYLDTDPKGTKVARRYKKKDKNTIATP
jgi:hypothetical protein